jgi:hypothetical protein
MLSLSLGSGIQHKEQSVHHPFTGLPDADLTQRKNLDAKFRKFCIAFLGDFLLNISFLTLNKSSISIQGVMKS